MVMESVCVWVINATDCIFSRAFFLGSGGRGKIGRDRQLVRGRGWKLSLKLLCNKVSEFNVEEMMP